MAIKNVVVKVKPFAFNVGDELFTCEFFGGQTVKVLSPVEKDGWVEKVKVLVLDTDRLWRFLVGKEQYIFPGDLGVPGFAYDDRKCSLFRSKKAADMHAGVYDEWLNKNPVIDDLWYDSYDY